jgi:hypothetical protein
MLAVKLFQHRRELAGDVRVTDADELMLCAGRVGQRTKHVEDGPDAHLLAGRADEAHRGVEGGCIHEADADPLDALDDLVRCQLHRDTQRFQEVSRAAPARCRPVAVLGDTDA